VAARNLVRQAEAAGDGGDGQWGMFQIILRETGEVIGDIGFHGPPDETGTVEIGYGIVEQYRGRGLAGESAAAICGVAWSRPEDLAQEVLIRAHSTWRKIGNLDRPEYYVRKMLVNEFLHWRRREWRQIPSGAASDVDHRSAPGHAVGLIAVR
jgi:RimJ/RimL family protein N-acetyltransferase